MAKIQFPICPTKTKYDEIRSKYLDKQITYKAIEAIDHIKPYKEGNDNLWFLNKLNNTDKHRNLLVVNNPSGYEGVYINKLLEQEKQSIKLPSQKILIKPANNLYPIKIGDILFIDKKNSESIDGLSFRFRINMELCEFEENKNKPLMSTLANLIHEVESIHLKLVCFYDTDKFK